MKSFMKIFLFFSGFALTVVGALSVFYKLFKKHCIIHIEFNPAEDNAAVCECEGECVCDECECEECECDDIDELEFTETEEK